MNVAVNMQSDHREFSDLDLEADADFKSTLRSLCGLFVSIHHGKVYFLHQTAREFLLADLSSTAVQPTLAWHESIRIRQAHTILAEKCIHYLALFNTLKPSDTDLDDKAFLDYSAENWEVHFREATVAESDPLVSIALAIGDPDSISYSLWFERYWSTKGPGYEAPLNFSNIFLSAFFGHVATLQILIVTGKVEIDSRDQLHHRTPLSYAAERGHDAVIKLLLATKKVEVDSRDDKGITPLSWAARRGHEAIVELLLATEKVEVDSRDDKGITPLSWAAMYGQEAIVELLLATKKVEVDSRDDDGTTPLSWAAMYGHEAIVELLLATGKVVVDIPEVRAAEQGHQGIVKLLRMASKQHHSPI